MDWVEGAMGSPWVYVALFAFAAIDAFFPVVPSESLVITAGVFAAVGRAEPRRRHRRRRGSARSPATTSRTSSAAPRAAVMQRAPSPDRRRRRAFERAGKLLADRGGTILIVCRYIPGARTAITLTAGAVRYRLRSFTFFDAIAALSWATYSALVGYLGGEAFEDDAVEGSRARPRHRADRDVQRSS